MPKLTQDTFIPPAQRVVAGFPFTRVSTYCKGLDGTDSLANEDRVLVHTTPHGTLLAAIDGITPRTKWRMPHPYTEEPVSTGWMGAYIVEKHLRRLTPGMDMETLMRGIHATWLAVLKAHAAPTEEIMGAVFTVYVPWEGEHGVIWRFGDPLWFYMPKGGPTNGVGSLQGELPANSRDARNRVAAIRQAMLEQGVLDKDLPNLPKHQLGHLARIGREAMDRQRLEAQGESWLKFFDRTMKLVARPVPLLGNVRRLILATDGVLVTPLSVSGALTFLHKLREADPLMLGTNPNGLQSAKGFVGFDGTIHPHTDDVGIVMAMV